MGAGRAACESPRDGDGMPSRLWALRVTVLKNRPEVSVVRSGLLSRPGIGIPDARKVTYLAALCFWI